MKLLGFLSMENAEIGLLLIALGLFVLTIMSIVSIISKKPITAASIAWLVVVILFKGIGPLIYFAYLAFHRDEITNKPGYQILFDSGKRIVQRML